MTVKKLFGAALLLAALGSLSAQGKDVRDTLFSSAGDRVIIEYDLAQSGAQTTVRFLSVQKKLGTANQKKYKKLDEVAVVLFDRTGTYSDVKFDGLTPTAFMVPAGVQYTYSQDGYFLLQDSPQLQFACSSETQLSLPIYLAHYEKKRHYKLFSECGALAFSTKVSTGGTTAAGGKGSRAAAQNTQGGATEVITSEELLDEGLTPTDEALIRISSVRSMLDRATKVPFSEELTHEASMLRELRYKITDADVSRQIGDVLDAYDIKKQELEAQAEASQQAAAQQQAAAAQQQAMEQQAKQDSIQAAQAKQASDDKKDMMWLIGGIAGLGMLLMVGKQVFQTIKNNKMQRMMMDNINKAQQQALGNVKIPGMENNPLGQQINQEIQREVRKKASAEGEAAKQRLQALRKGNAQQPTTPTSPTPPTPPTQPTSPTTPGKRPLRKASEVKAAAGIDTRASGIEITAKPTKKPSLNDAIPAKYKRWRKPGNTPDAPSAS